LLKNDEIFPGKKKNTKHYFTVNKCSKLTAAESPRKEAHQLGLPPTSGAQ
jgi:hypothetical protein